MELINLRHPNADDGVEMHHLVKRCPPLDENSRYCNLLQALHFSSTSVVAQRAGELVGFVTGHTIPDHPNVLFVWQVAVSPDARGERLGNRMLDWLVSANPNATHVETTVTPDNVPSTKMFQRLADDHGTSIEKSVLFARQPHFEGLHEDEVLFRIGPFAARPAK